MAQTQTDTNKNFYHSHTPDHLPDDYFVRTLWISAVGVDGGIEDAIHTLQKWEDRKRCMLSYLFNRRKFEERIKLDQDLQIECGIGWRKGVTLHGRSWQVFRHALLKVDHNAYYVLMHALSDGKELARLRKYMQACDDEAAAVEKGERYVWQIPKRQPTGW
jgi:hypothetical protein